MSHFFWGLVVLFSATVIFYIVFLSLVYYWQEQKKKTIIVIVPLIFTFEFFLIGFLILSIILILFEYLPQILKTFVS